MADFYFTDRKYNQLGIASTDELASSSVIAIDDIGGQEGDYHSVDGGYRSYSATLHFSPDHSARVKEMAKVGNFVLFKDRAGESVWTTILSSEHDPLAGTNTFVAEDASIDLINGTVGTYAASRAMTIAQYIELFAGDSGFVIGYNEIPDLTRTLKWDSDDSSILTRILSVATQFGAELSFRFEVRGLSVIGKYIDIRKHIGGNKGIYLHVDTDLNKVVTTSDIADLCTAIAGTGGTPEGSNDPITLKGYHWIDPNGRYVLGGDGVLRDPVALMTWSRLLSNANTNPVDAHITRTKTYEATTQATLLQSVLSDLEKFNHPAVNYEVDIAKLPDNVSIGDTVYLVDEDEQLFLSARVLELTYSYSNESGTATLGDYLIQASQIDPAYRELADQIKNIKTVQYYPWIRYADDDKGTNMSAFPANKKYMAFRYSEKSSVPSDNPADYAGRWSLIRGKDGDNGKPGPAGTSSYLHTAYANSIDGKQGFSTTDGNGKSYFGQYVDQTQADSTDPTKYSWALFKGPQGPPGVPGSKDVPYTYIQLGTPTSPKKGDLWWHGTTLNDATALQYYNGTTWIDQSIQQAVLSIKKLQSIEIDTATINSPMINVPFTHASIEGGGIKSTGKLSLNGTSYSIDGNIEDSDGKPNGQNYHTELNPDGLLSYLTETDGTTKKDISRISMGTLELSHLVSGLGTSANYITSSLNALAIARLNNVGALLWEGTSLMGWSGNAQGATPSKPISDCLNGWLLIWSEYKNGVAQDYDYIVTPIYRVFVQAHPGRLLTLPMIAYGGTSFNKKVYPTNTNIVGDKNNSGGAGNPSIAGNYVLVNIFAF